jgi:UDP-N-acetylmuramyl pentapeptide phosphotransferase/UDP-N-acetylglucosamine-1-phosphate transferase
MMFFLFGILCFILLFLINILFLRKNFLIEHKTLVTSPHKKFSLDNNTKTVVSGGIFFSIFLFLIIKNNIYLFYYLLIIFIIGLFSDLKLLKSPIYRIVLQLITTIIFIYFSENINIGTRIFFIDNLLNHREFQIIFTTLCILILINGFNFIDGVNLLSSLNFLITCFFLNLLFFKYNEGFDSYLIYFIILISIFCIYNFYSKSFLGDGGVYLISAFIAERIIFISSSSHEISPYYIVNMLWYPAFENLFSIIRRFIFKKSPDQPDNSHLHHYLLFYIKKKKFFRQHYIESSFSGIIINLFILITLILATLRVFETKYQIIILFINLTSYLTLYIYLRFNYLTKKK